MKYALIVKDVIEQTQPYYQEGFVEVPDESICGMYFVEGKLVEPDVSSDMLKLDIMTQIASLEAQQARPMRELLLDPTSTFAREKLDSIDSQIASLRKQLNVLNS